MKRLELDGGASEEATYVRERDGCTVFTVETLPRSANGTGVVLAYGAGHKSTAHRNRVWVRLARQLATAGFTVVRFDRCGSGDAFGTPRDLDLTDADPAAVLEAEALVARRGIDRSILIGTCYGGRAVLEAAARSERCVAVSAASVTVRPMPALNPHGASDAVADGVSIRFAALTAALGRAALPVQFLYGTRDAISQPALQVQGTSADPFGAPGASLEFLAGRIHGFPVLEPQRAYIDAALGFCARVSA